MSSHETSLHLEIDFGDGSTLLPVVSQDWRSKEVLIVSWTNRKAFELTQQTGIATYWSRSRNSLWIKGETSGNKLKVHEIRVNCEQNSLLYLVEQEGTGACHALRADKSAHTSCYYRKVNPDNSLILLEE